MSSGEEDGLSQPQMSQIVEEEDVVTNNANSAYISQLIGNITDIDLRRQLKRLEVSDSAVDGMFLGKSLSDYSNNSIFELNDESILAEMLSEKPQFKYYDKFLKGEELNETNASSALIVKDESVSKKDQIKHLNQLKQVSKQKKSLAEGYNQLKKQIEDLQFQVQRNNGRKQLRQSCSEFDSCEDDSRINNNDSCTQTEKKRNRRTSSSIGREILQKALSDQIQQKNIADIQTLRAQVIQLVEQKVEAESKLRDATNKLQQSNDANEKLKKEAEKQLIQIKERESIVKKKEEQVKEQEEKLIQQEAILKEREYKVSQRENDIQQAEPRLREREKKFSNSQQEEKGDGLKEKKSNLIESPMPEAKQQIHQEIKDLTLKERQSRSVVSSKFDTFSASSNYFVSKYNKLPPKGTDENYQFQRNRGSFHSERPNNKEDTSVLKEPSVQSLRIQDSTNKIDAPQKYNSSANSFYPLKGQQKLSIDKIHSEIRQLKQSLLTTDFLLRQGNHAHNPKVQNKNADKIANVTDPADNYDQPIENRTHEQRHTSEDASELTIKESKELNPSKQMTRNGTLQSQLNNNLPTSFQDIQIPLQDKTEADHLPAFFSVTANDFKKQVNESDKLKQRYNQTPNSSRNASNILFKKELERSQNQEINDNVSGNSRSSASSRLLKNQYYDQSINMVNQSHQATPNTQQKKIGSNLLNLYQLQQPQKMQNHNDNNQQNQKLNILNNLNASTSNLQSNSQIDLQQNNFNNPFNQHSIYSNNHANSNKQGLDFSQLVQPFSINSSHVQSQTRPVSASRVQQKQIQSSQTLSNDGQQHQQNIQPQLQQQQQQQKSQQQLIPMNISPNQQHDWNQQKKLNYQKNNTHSNLGSSQTLSSGQKPIISQLKVDQQDIQLFKMQQQQQYLQQQQQQQHQQQQQQQQRGNYIPKQVTEVEEDDQRLLSPQSLSNNFFSSSQQQQSSKDLQQFGQGYGPQQSYYPHSFNNCNENNISSQNQMHSTFSNNQPCYNYQTRSAVPSLNSSEAKEFSNNNCPVPFIFDKQRLLSQSSTNFMTSLPSNSASSNQTNQLGFNQSLLTSPLQFGMNKNHQNGSHKHASLSKTTAIYSQDQSHPINQLQNNNQKYRNGNSIGADRTYFQLDTEENKNAPYSSKKGENLKRLNKQLAELELEKNQVVNKIAKEENQRYSNTGGIEKKVSVLLDLNKQLHLLDSQILGVRQLMMDQAL